MSVAYSITEGQLVRTFHGRPEAAAFLTERSDCLRILGFEHWETGGGCTALGIERVDSAQLLITDDGADPYDMPDQAPKRADTTVTLGYYSPGGEQLEWREYAPAETEALCRAVIAWLEAQYDATGGDFERSNGPCGRQRKGGAS